MGVIGILGWIAVGLIAALAVLAFIGFLLTRRKRNQAKQEDVRTEHVTENVADLRDRFNRARYMNEDGN